MISPTLKLLQQMEDWRILYRPQENSEPLHNRQSGKMLYIIGLGLADEKDISVKGLEIVKRASRVYLEAYTAILLVEKDALVGGESMASRTRMEQPGS